MKRTSAVMRISMFGIVAIIVAVLWRTVASDYLSEFPSWVSWVIALVGTVALSELICYNLKRPPGEKERADDDQG